MNDISVYLSRQKGGGVPNQKNTFTHLFFVLNKEWYNFRFTTFKTPMLGPLIWNPSVYLDVINVIK